MLRLTLTPPKLSIMAYNGWTNYETWLTNLWFENFEFTDQIKDGVFDDMDNDDIRDYVSDYIEQYVSDSVDESINSNGFIQDLVTSSLGDVDWRDIADHYVDDIKEAVKERIVEEDDEN